MKPVTEFLPPKILIVDDERQIHASIRLRLGKNYEYYCCTDTREALARIQREEFDLCFADIHMPKMDGLTFIETARQRDPCLGFVVVSAFDTDENLRRAIPLHVCEFIPKPLPEFNRFEDQVPDWIELTRRRRKDRSLAAAAGTIAQDLEVARLEREVELVASETARDALLQTASLLTTVHAHLVTATTTLTARAKSDSTLAHLSRNLEEARKTADASIAVSEGFFGSAYGSRDSSPAVVDQGLRHAANIAARLARAGEDNKEIDLLPVDERLPIRDLTGIDFLLLMVPALGAALTLATPGTTVRVRTEHLPRLDTLIRDPRYPNFLWVNRRNSAHSQSGVLISMTAHAPALTRSSAEDWLNGEYAPLAGVTAQGLLTRLKMGRGFLGFSLREHATHFNLLIALPV